MRVFVSHNSKDKADARILATQLVERGASVWFDEWDITLGGSIASGIDRGLATADSFAFFWSANAARSRWVTAEMNAYLHRRMQDASLRIVPIILDATPLPVLFTDFLGFQVKQQSDYTLIADALTGIPKTLEVAGLMQQRMKELATSAVPDGDLLPYIVCPHCGGTNMHRSRYADGKGGTLVASVCLSKGYGFAQARRVPAGDA
jgi:hypothetical protein